MAYASYALSCVLRGPVCFATVSDEVSRRLRLELAACAQKHGLGSAGLVSLSVGFIVLPCQPDIDEVGRQGLPNIVRDG